MGDGERKIGRRGLIELAGVSLAAVTFSGAIAGCERAASQTTSQPKKDKAMSNKMPVLFVGHGSPMNAVVDNAWSRGFGKLAEGIPKPKAILAVSAHWYVPGTFLTSNAQPKTIHDFGGFPRELYEIQYPASGYADLAERVSGLLSSQSAAGSLAADFVAALRDDWGLDHGTWQVLRHTYPNADVPVVQLSIDHRLPPAQHVAIGKALAPLREEGVLIFGSGNIVHNLRHAIRGLQTGSSEIPPWAEAFDAHIATALEQRDTTFLASALGDDTGRMAHPSPDHYFPLLYTAGAAGADDALTFPITGFDSSISMRSVRWG